ncbi:MAG: hypothetical protein GX846_04175, partial [Deltaproteobacteria bacterium]|nr:hypothetical protein [Deltaproteobacteria bacterium]
MQKITRLNYPFVCLIFFISFFVHAACSHAQAVKADNAPVPEVVAIPRPADSEVKVAKDALEKYLQTADPSIKEINRKYPGLISVTVPRDNTATIPGLAPFFQMQHQANLEIARKGNIDLLFLGDSITDFWRSTNEPFAGKPVFDKYFGDLKVANFGIAGDTTQGVLFRLQNGEGKGFSPKLIMLMIGTNNTTQNTGPEIAEGIGAVVLELQKDFPGAKILLLAIFPRDRPGAQVRKTLDEVNTRIS